MYTDARVIEIRNDGTVLVGCSTESCNACKVRTFCNAKNDNSYTAINKNNVDIKEGDTVELFLPPAKTIGSTALVFALPLALFPLGYILCKALFHTNELINVLCGFCFMALAFAVSGVITKKNKNSLMPIIVRVK